MTKIKLSGLVVLITFFSLLGFLAVTTPAQAMTCNSATLTGTVITGTPPTHARFEYGTNQSTVASGGGTTTTVQIFNSDGTFPIQQFISGLTENTTYYFRLVVTNNYGTKALNINTFTTPSCNSTPTGQSPTVSLVANPSSVPYNGSSILTWSSTNATSCTSSWSGNQNTSGSYSTGNLTNDTTYNITCTNSISSAVASATVSVQNQTTNICRDASAINYGSYGSCIYQQYNYQICRDTSATNHGSYGSCIYPQYNYNYQTCRDVNATNYGNYGTCVYQQYNYQICRDTSATNYGSYGSCIYPQIQIQVCQDPSATNYGGYLPCIYPQRVNNQPTVVLYADQSSVPFNGSATVRWLTTNSASCFASGGSVGWAGVKSIGPGSFYTGSLTGTKTYSISCSNPFGSASDSVTITVRSQTVSSPKPTPTSLVLITSSVDRNQPIVPTVDNTRPRPGDEINYTVNYQNIGTGAITSLTLRVNLPAEVDYLSSSPNNPIISGNTLVFNLGTLKANGEGTVTIKTRVQEDIPAGTNLDFPATLTYLDPSGVPQSVFANVSAQVSSESSGMQIGANVFGAGFLPTSLFGWLILIILILVLVFLVRHIFNMPQNGEGAIVSDHFPNNKRNPTHPLE